MASMLRARPSSRLGTPRRSFTATPQGTPRQSFTATPQGSPSPWFDDVDHQLTSHFYDQQTFTPTARRLSVMRGARDRAGFSTPQRITIMGREHDLVEFRTPQHPSSGTNNWGGASPLLSPNISKKSLAINYLRFNPLADYDEGGYYGTDLGTILGTPVQIESGKRGEDAKRRKRDWILNRFGWRKRREGENLGSSVEKKTKKRNWLNKKWLKGW